MPVDLGRKQTIEEITDGRIRKKPREEARPAGRAKAARPTARERPVKR